MAAGGGGVGGGIGGSSGGGEAAAGSSGGGRTAKEVRDLLALRVVLHPEKSASTQLGERLMRRAPLSPAETEALLCFGAYRAMLKLWREVPGRFKDFVRNPKPNGYQSVRRDAPSHPADNH